MNVPEISIFLDTNCLEVREAKSLLHLFELKVPAEFYTLCNFIADHDFIDKVEICISEVTWMEIKQHLIQCYEETHDTLERDIDQYGKKLGGLLSVEYSIVHNSSEEYLEHVKTIADEFLECNPCKVVPYPKSVELLDVLVGKAVSTQAPFCRAKGRKEHSDAGFKDALIFETIISHCNQNKTSGVFITKDKDFYNPSSRIYIVDTIDKAKEYLLDKYGLTDEDRIKHSFETDKYLQEKVILETGNTYDESVRDFTVIAIKKAGDSNAFQVDSQCLINETQYDMSFIYDAAANEIIEVQQTLQNE